MATATERWSDRKLLKQPNAWTATRAWDVVDATSETDAITATAIVINSPHPLNSFLLCKTVGADRVGFTVYKVTASYEIPANGNCNNNDGNSPATTIDWKQNASTEPYDTDLQGNAILNSAQQAFSTNPTKLYISRTLTITRKEPYYDKNKADAYELSVNSDTVVFTGYQFLPGQIFCQSIQPTGPYPLNPPFVTIAYTFETRTPLVPNLTPLQKRHPFQLRVCDQGNRGFYADSDNHTTGFSLDEFYTAKGEKLSHEVLLDGGGVPIDDSIKVGVNKVPATALGSSIPGGWFVDSLPGGDARKPNLKAVFFVIPRYFEKPFNGLVYG